MKKIATLLIILISKLGFSQEILGGDIVWTGKKINPFGYDNLVDDFVLNLYVKDYPLTETKDKIYIYRKSDGKYVDVIDLTLSGSPVKINNNNLSCTDQNNIVAYHQVYTAKYPFKKTKFTDLRGYILVYDNNFRSAELKNIKSPNQTAFSIVSEIPAFTAYDIPFRSPYFKATEKIFFCKSKSFQLDFGCVDPDNFTLKYSFNTPIQGNATRAIPGNPELKYRPANKFSTWETNHGVSKVLGTGSTFTIDPNSGMVSGMASSTGLYTFSVRVDKINSNGKIIGYNIKDLSIWVIDCAVTTIAQPIITENNIVINKTGICQGSSTFLEVPLNPNHNYQWQDNGINIKNEISNKLNVKTEGNYSVTVSHKLNCVKEQVASSVNVFVENKKPELTISSKYNSQFYGCYDEPVTIEVLNNTENKIIEWNQLISTTKYFIKESPKIDVINTGTYLANFKTTGSMCPVLISDVRVFIGQLYPVITEKPKNGTYEVCPDRFTTLVTSPPPNGRKSFRWFRGDEELNAVFQTFETNLPGDYHVLVGEYGCFTKSEIYKVRPAKDCPNDLEQIFVPNAFSPNNDTYNDTWEISNKDLFIDMEVFIYDRWSNLVFYSKGYQTNFNGKLDGKDLPTGTYIYQIKHNKEGFVDKFGELVLIR